MKRGGVLVLFRGWSALACVFFALTFLCGCVVVDSDFGDGCGPLETCDMGCVGGDCTLVCEEGSVCDASCTGGDCEMVCEREASCNFSCTGGDCRFLCHATADCDLGCVGGGCIIEHFGSVALPTPKDQ